MHSLTKIGINQTLDRFGGFVRYYDTTEPLPDLARWARSGRCRNILACCGGGNQALTMLGAGKGERTLWAVDINPAQLFVLAAKASFLKEHHVMPSFEQIRRAFPGRVAALKKNISCLPQKCLYHRQTGRMIALPERLAEKYALVIDNEMFVLRKKSGPYWQEDSLFIKKVCARFGHLQLARMDIFDSPDYFKSATLDLIYLSDISWPQNLPYYQVKLAQMVNLLRLKGRIISYLTEGDDFLGQGTSPGRMLLKLAGELGLKIRSQQADDNYLVFERMRMKR